MLCIFRSTFPFCILSVCILLVSFAKLTLSAIGNPRIALFANDQYASLRFRSMLSKNYSFLLPRVEIKLLYYNILAACCLAVFYVCNMSLETKDNAYEDVYKPSDPEDNWKYYEGYVDKKETFKWVQYWCVLKEHNIHFFKNVATQIKDNYVGFFALEQPTNVDIAKSKEGRYEWTIKTKKGKITLRTNVASLRDGWIDSMEKSLKNEPPSKESYILEGSGPVSPKHKENPSLPNRSPSRKSSVNTGGVISEKQVNSIQELPNEIGTIMADTDEELRIQDELLNGNEGWYQASFCREEVERILSSEEKGVFIVRDYVENRTKNKMGFVISLKDETGQMRHHRIRKTDNTFFMVGHEERCFESLHKLLMFFITSQRKKIILVPFNPEKQNRRQPVHDQHVSSSPHHHTITKVGRSKSLQHRRLPPSPPETKSDHRNSILDSNLPQPPSEVQNGHGQNVGDYEKMTSSKFQKNRPLPTPPMQGDDQLYLNAVPFSQRSLPVEPPADQSYINVPPPATIDESCSYENTENMQVLEEQPPTLPPRTQRSSSYVNCPRSNMPGRNRFLKSQTFS